VKLMIRSAGVDKRVVIRGAHSPRDLSFRCSDVSVWNGNSKAPRPKSGVVLSWSWPAMSPGSPFLVSLDLAEQFHLHRRP
jgi:hypothetical protein